MTAFEDAPVIVGMDTTAPSLAAVRWATAEAAVLRAPLQLVHAYPGPLDRHVRQSMRIAADAALDTLRENDIRTEITISTMPRHGTALGVLLDQAEHARFVVVATHGRGRPLEGFSESVAAALAARAACPIITVPRNHLRPVGHGPVVVGVDGSPGSEAALDFAFAAAAAHGTKLIAVRAWSDSADPRGTEQNYWISSMEEQALADRLEPLQGKYPGVRVRPEVVSDQAANALLRFDSTAQLMVVGSRGESEGLSALLLGSTSQALLYRANCPVAVVRGTGAVSTSTGGTALTG